MMGTVIPFNRSTPAFAAACDARAARNPFRRHLPGPERPDIAVADRQSVERVMAAHPDLAPNGFYAERCQPRTDFDAARLGMTGEVRLGEFRRAFAFLLVRCRPRATINRNASSYWLKHEVERAMRDAGERNAYVSNGMFLTAALRLGFRVERIPGTPNAFLNVELKRESQS